MIESRRDRPTCLATLGVPHRARRQRYPSDITRNHCIGYSHLGLVGWCVPKIVRTQPPNSPDPIIEDGRPDDNGSVRRTLVFPERIIEDYPLNHSITFP